MRPAGSRRCSIRSRGAYIDHADRILEDHHNNGPFIDTNKGNTRRKGSYMLNKYLMMGYKTFSDKQTR